MKSINDILLVFFKEDKAEKILSREFANPQDDVSSAWYVKTLIGVSAWFASLSFLAAIFVFLESAKGAGVFIGIFLCIVAGILNHLFGEKIFVQQFSLSICLAGQAAATVFFSENENSQLSSYIFSVILSAILIVAYRYSVMRFIAIQALVVSIVLIMHEMKWYYGISILIIILAIVVYILWVYESECAASSIPSLLKICAYGFTFSLICLPILSTNNILNWKSPSWIVATIGVALVFIFAQGNIFSVFNKNLINHYFIGSSILSVGLTAITLNSPGIIITIFVMIIGFFRGNRIVTVLSSFCLGVYLIMFYYNLALPLIYKSYILMGSGVLFIVAWAVFTRFKGALVK